MVRIRAHSVQNNDIWFQGGQTARCLLNWSQLWEPGTWLKTYTRWTLSGFGEPTWALRFTSSALMNNSVHVTWGSRIVAGRVLWFRTRKRWGRCQLHLHYTYGNSPSIQRGRKVSQGLFVIKKKLERNGNQLGCFPGFLFSGESLMQTPATLFCLLLNFLLWTFV